MAQNQRLKEKEPFINVMIVVNKEYSRYHMKFDLSSCKRISDLKIELAKLVNIPAKEQQWFIKKRPADDARNLNDYNIVESDVIEIRILNN